MISKEFHTELAKRSAAVMAAQSGREFSAACDRLDQLGLNGASPHQIHEVRAAMSRLLAAYLERSKP